MAKYIRNFLLILGATIVITVIALVVFFLLMVRWITPDFNSLLLNTRSLPEFTIVDKEGNTIHASPPESLYKVVNRENLPQTLIYATTAIEDPNFFNHYSFDWLTPFRLVYGHLTGNRITEMGSPLTQQVVKVALNDERTLNRVLKSFFLEILIYQRLTKTEILELYFNQMMYGREIKGVSAAAQIYFQKPVDELTLAESAVLAGIPQSPSRYSPFSGKVDEAGQPFWKIRAAVILVKMKEQWLISEEEYVQAHQELQTMAITKPFSNQEQVVAELVMSEFNTLFGEHWSNSIHIKSTLDLNYQQKVSTQAAKVIVSNKNINWLSVTVTDKNNHLLTSNVVSNNQQKGTFYETFQPYLIDGSIFLPQFIAIDNITDKDGRTIYDGSKYHSASDITAEFEQIKEKVSSLAQNPNFTEDFKVVLIQQKLVIAQSNSNKSVWLAGLSEDRLVTIHINTSQPLQPKELEQIITSF